MLLDCFRMNSDARNAIVAAIIFGVNSNDRRPGLMCSDVNAITDDLGFPCARPCHRCNCWFGKEYEKVGAAVDGRLNQGR